MIKKMFLHTSESYITLFVCFPHIILYLSLLSPNSMNVKLLFIFLTVIYTPIIIWSLLIRTKESTSKFHIGSVKLFFSFNTLPIVFFIFIHFNEINLFNLINLYILLMTAFFFTLDGQTDLLDAFKNTRYYQDKVIQKLSLGIFMRLLRRFVIFVGMSILIAISYIIFSTTLQPQFIQLPIYSFSALNSTISIFSCFILGWVLLGFKAYRTMRIILEERVEYPSTISNWVRLLQLPEHIRLLITWFPIIVFIAQLSLTAYEFGSFSTKPLLISGAVGIPVYLTIFFLQRALFKKYKFF